MDIKTKLRWILEESSWSQDELAHILGVAPKSLSFWLTGKAEPRSRHQAKIDELYLNIIGRTEVDEAHLEDLKKQALATHLDLRELMNNEDLLRLAILHLTYHTNNIEGSTMTMEDVATVLDDENAVINNKSYREQAEARNHRAAFLYLLGRLRDEGKNFRWTPGLILDVHQRLMNGLMDDAGQFRKYGVRVLGSQVARANSASVPRRIGELTDYMNSPTSDLLERLARTHAVFEQIHPFGDGNGRAGRLVLFAEAIKYGIVPPLVLKERKHAYYHYLEQAHRTENYDLLAMFIAESILSTNQLIK
ncbi:Fic family protein [Candidatus Saccharibacteria bacterium]|nr:Fic family protein [Candidatus Saccharibacteria bacterium]